MTTLFNQDDAIRGARVGITARRIGKPQLVNQSARHKASRLTAWDNVHCVIERPLKERPKNQAG